MKKIVLSIAVLILSCNSKKKEKLRYNKPESQVIEKTVAPTNVEKKLKSDSESTVLDKKVKVGDTIKETEIKEIALSFHKWYLKVTNDYQSDTSIDFVVSEGKNNSCVIDYTPYVHELRKLGTISENFIENEKLRTKPCAESITNMKWSDYGNGIPENCIPYMYWTNSQDITDGVEALSITKVNENWKVEIYLYNNGTNGEKIYADRLLDVEVVLENGKYLIHKISWKNEYTTN